MNGTRVAELQQGYRDLGLWFVDRQPRKTGGVSNLRRRLKQFWTKRGRLPQSPIELLEFDGMSETAARSLCLAKALPGRKAA